MTFLLPVAALVLLAPGQAPEVSEARAKVMLLEKLVRFVEWPGEAPPADQSFVIGVVGRTPFGDELDEYFRKRTLKGRPVRIRYFRGTQDAEGCDLLFVCASERDALPALLAKVRQRPVLTLTESPGFTKAGVMVGMVREGDHMAFEVNLGRARESGFRIAPGLLQLAKVQG